MVQERNNVITQENGSNRTDRMLAVTMPSHWLMLAGLFLITVGFMLWACFGTLSRTVTASALYHPEGSDQGEIIALIPLTTGKTLDPGMEVVVNLTGYNLEEYGNMRGSITYVDDYTTSIDDMKNYFNDDLVVNAFVQSGPCVAVVCKLQEDKESANGYFWTNEKGRTLKIHDGTWAMLTIIQETIHPITLGIPQLSGFFGS